MESDGFGIIVYVISVRLVINGSCNGISICVYVLVVIVVGIVIRCYVFCLGVVIWFWNGNYYIFYCVGSKCFEVESVG